MSFTVKERLDELTILTKPYPKYTHANYISLLLHSCNNNCLCCQTVKTELEELQNILYQTLEKFNRAILQNYYDYSLAEQLRFLTGIIEKIKTLPLSKLCMDKK